MVNFYTTVEVFIEKDNLKKLEGLCLLNGLEFDHEPNTFCHDEKCKIGDKLFGYENSDYCYISGCCPPRSIYRIFEDADFKITVKLDL